MIFRIRRGRVEMKQTKKKLVWADSVIMAILTFIVLLLVNSAAWAMSAWDNVDFSTIMFQMHTPLNGTNSEIIDSFINICISRTIQETLVIAAGYWLIKCLSRNLKFSFSLTFFNLRTKLDIGKNNRVWKWFPTIYFWGMLAVYGILCYTNAKKIGFFEYLDNIREKTTIFEEQYIDPENIAIDFPEKKRNLILIYLESMESTYASVEVGGGKPVNYIPHLTELAQNNINFSNGNQLGGGGNASYCGFTIGAIVGTSSGVPFKSMIEGNSMSEYAQFLPGIVTLGDILEEEGYSNYFLCGSEAEFGGRKLFYEEHGNYHILDYNYAKEQGYTQKEKRTFWGYEDTKLFDIAKIELEKLGNSGELFNFTMLTVDTHHPSGYICELCEEQYEHPYANAIACSDRQVVEFVSWIEAQEWYENTTVILIGDHLSMAADFWDDIGSYERKTYNCFLNLPTGLNTKNEKNRKFDTLDYFPTILASLGVRIEGERLGLGTNLFSDRKTLLEELGVEYEEELAKYSEFYIENFEKDDMQED